MDGESRTCPTCKGAGSNFCPVCDNEGGARCDFCHGDSTCLECRGDGCIVVSREELERDPAYRYHQELQRRNDQELQEIRKERREWQLRHFLPIPPGLDLQTVVAALYNAASHLGGPSMLAYDPAPASRADGERYIREIIRGGHIYFDYLNGRYMKLEFLDDTHVDVQRYDQVYSEYDVGDAAAVLEIASRKGPQAQEILDRHLILERAFRDDISTRRSPIG